jgi:hypothetical protein
MATRPTRTGRPASSGSPAQPAGLAAPDKPAGSGDPAPPTGSAAPAARPPAGLRVAAAAQVTEAAGLCVAAAFAAASTADGRSYQLASGIALILIALGTAAGLAAIAAGLARARPWSRTPAAMTQLFVVIAGLTLLDGHRPEWGVPALMLAAVCLAGLFTPASLRALNRPSGKNQPRP